MKNGSFRATSLRDSVPSGFATKISLPLQYARNSPLGDQAPSYPSMSPRRRGDPPTTGTLHKGPEGGIPCPSTTRRLSPSGDIESGIMFAEGRIASFLGSPPEVDISAPPWKGKVPRPR